jgi:biotin carboxyl carrier protein
MSATRVEVVAAGRIWIVHIEPAGEAGRYTIAIDGEAPIAIDAAGVATNGTTAWSLRDVASGVVSTVAVTLGANGEGEAAVAGHTLPVALPTRRRRSRALLGAGDGEQRVLAPMPGKVVRVLVAVGDPVEPRQGLVVVEAMKMENELTATRAGTVREITVVEGASVEAGRLLVVVG